MYKILRFFLIFFYWSFQNNNDKNKIKDWNICIWKNDDVYKGENPKDAAATYHVFVYYMLMC